LAPIGSAPVSLAAGVTIAWPRLKGDIVNLQVLKVIAQPDPEGGIDTATRPAMDAQG